MEVGKQWILWFYFVLCMSWKHKDLTELRDSAAEGIVIF
jgi:hypothetical protein